jgi:hypothetical protein
MLLVVCKKPVAMALSGPGAPVGCVRQAFAAGPDAAARASRTLRFSPGIEVVDELVQQGFPCTGVLAKKEFGNFSFVFMFRFSAFMRTPVFHGGLTDVFDAAVVPERSLPLCVIKGFAHHQRDKSFGFYCSERLDQDLHSIYSELCISSHHCSPTMPSNSNLTSQAHSNIRPRRVLVDKVLLFID